MLDIPEYAVRCFEHWSDTKITVYETETVFYNSEQQRFMHCCEECSIVKKSHVEHCMKFDWRDYKTRRLNYPDGCVKICHAGFLEWIMPVVYKGKILALLIAGIRYAPDSIPDSIPLYKDTAPRLKTRFRNVKKTTGDEVLFVMEGLRQLASRLVLWIDSMHSGQNWRTSMKRDEQILFLIKRRCRDNITLPSLASELHLSPSRTAHIVKELTGKNFKTLVTEYRLDHGAKLLRYSGENVAQIAEACGYDNVSNFHKAFRKKFKTTPLKYRRQNAQD